MPDPVAGNLIVEIVLGSGMAGILAQSYVGFRANKQELKRVHKRIDSLNTRNDEAHKRIEDGVKDLNDRGRKNTVAIAETQTRCDERHPPLGFRHMKDES